MSVKLTIILQAKPCCFNCCQHIVAIIKDLDSERIFYINFGSRSQLEPGKLFANQIDFERVEQPNIKFFKHNRETNTLLIDCCPSSVIELYSHKDFDTFIHEFNERFPSIANYRFCSNNCADAVNFALDELCPDPAFTTVSCFLYKVLCAPLFFVFCCISSIHSPLCATPADTYRKARWLSWTTEYGKEISLASNPNFNNNIANDNAELRV